jgi:DNA modification methylase
MAWRVLQGKSEEVLPTLPADSADCLVCDPPAGISFLNKGWDSDRGGRDEWVAWLKGVMAEALRVVKPGGYGLVWAIPRTSHWTARALEDAGWQVVDIVHHAFATGFPKGVALDKAIDKLREDECRHVTAFVAKWRDEAGLTNGDIDNHFGFHGMAGHWTTDKSQPSIPTPEQWEQLKAFLGFPDEMDEEVARLNGRKGTHGEEWQKREVIGRKTSGIAAVWNEKAPTWHREFDLTAPANDTSARWEGWNTTLKPAIEHWILVRKPLSEKSFARNVLRWGTGGLNIGACEVARAAEDVPGWHASGADGSAGYGAGCGTCDHQGWLYEHTDGTRNTFGAGMTDNAELWAAWRQVPCPDCPAAFRIRAMSPEEIQVRRGDKGRWPAHFVLTHAEGCRRVGSERVKGCPATVIQGGKDGGGFAPGSGDGTRHSEFEGYGDADGMERVEVWECEDGCPVLELNRQSGESKSSAHLRHNMHTLVGYEGASKAHTNGGHSDSGGAGRFFNTFQFCPKPSRSEKEAGCEELPVKLLRRVNPGGLEHDPRWAPKEVRNGHPTVKPVTLMRHFVRLLCPKGGEVLDPFAGSGTTGVAAILEECHFTGIEADLDGEGFVEIIRARCQRAAEQVGHSTEDRSPQIDTGGPQERQETAPSRGKAPTLRGRPRKAVSPDQLGLFEEVAS